jgi:hypothetical protein
MFGNPEYWMRDVEKDIAQQHHIYFKKGEGL